MTRPPKKPLVYEVIVSCVVEPLFLQLLFMRPPSIQDILSQLPNTLSEPSVKKLSVLLQGAVEAASTKRTGLVFSRALNNMKVVLSIRGIIVNSPGENREPLRVKRDSRPSRQRRPESPTRRSSSRGGEVD